MGGGVAGSFKTEWEKIMHAEELFYCLHRQSFFAHFGLGEMSYLWEFTAQYLHHNDAYLLISRDDDGAWANNTVNAFGKHQVSEELWQSQRIFTERGRIAFQDVDVNASIVIGRFLQITQKKVQ